MNSKQRRQSRRHPVEKGYGPRHAFNAQEGDELVPEELPTPPDAAPTRGGRLFDELRKQAVPDEVIEEIRRNPTGAKALSTYAALGIMLMPGMGGKRGPGTPKSGKVPQPGLKKFDPAPRYEGPPEAAFGKEDYDALQAKLKGLQKPDEQFPSLNKPPYDALKEPSKLEWEKNLPPETNKVLDAPLSGEKTPSWHELSPEGQEQFFKEGGFKDKLEAAMNWDYYAGHMPEHMKPLEPKDPSFPPEEVQKMQDLQDFLKPPKEPPASTGERWGHNIPPDLEPPYDPLDWPEVGPDHPRFKKGTKGVRKNPKKVGRPRKIGVEKGFGPRHAANAKEGSEDDRVPKARGEDLTSINTDTVPAMLTPREAVLNRNAAELAGREEIEALNRKGNELAEQGVDLAAKPQKLQEGTQQINENPFYASQHPLELENKLGWDPSKPTYGPHSGEPTRRGIDVGLNALGNLTGIPGVGFLAGKLGRGLWHLIQNMQANGASKEQIQQVVAQVQENAPLGGAGGGGGGGRGDKWHDIFGPRSSASGTPGVGVGIGPTGAPAVGREWWSPDFGRWDLGASGQGAGGYNLAGPGGGFGTRGVGFGGNTVGNFATAIGFDRLGAGSGPSNLTWGRIGMEGQDRPHFNPFFGGQSADKMAGGPSVKLRQKGDKDVKANNSKPKKLQGGSNYVGGAQPAKKKPDYMPPGVQPAQLPGYGGPPEQVGGMPGPQPPLWWQHKRNMAQGGPSLDWQHKRNLAIAHGHDQPAMPPGAGPFTEPPGYGYAGPAPVPPPSGGGFYPPKGNWSTPLQGGTDEVQTIGEPPRGEEAYGPPVQLSEPQLDLLKQAAKEQGLNASQIAGIAKAFSSFGGGGGGYSSDANVAGATDVSGGFYGLSQSPRGYSGGINDIGYPPFIAPGAEFHADKGGWMGPYDPMYMIPQYQGGIGEVQHLRRGRGWIEAGGGDEFDPGAWFEPGEIYNPHELHSLGVSNSLGWASTTPPGFSAGGPTKSPSTWTYQGGQFGWTPQAIPVTQSADVNIAGRSRHLPERRPS